MKRGVQARMCWECEWREILRYASGEMSIRCTHPANDPKTTRDIILLESCPKEKEKRGHYVKQVKQNQLKYSSLDPSGGISPLPPTGKRISGKEK